MRLIDKGRFRIVLFDRFFTPNEQDRGPQATLENELQGILNWALRCCMEWQEFSLAPLQKVFEQLNHYNKDMYTDVKFSEDRFVISLYTLLPSCQLYTDYRQWFRNTGKQS